MYVWRRGEHEHEDLPTVFLFAGVAALPAPDGHKEATQDSVVQLQRPISFVFLQLSCYPHPLQTLIGVPIAHDQKRGAYPAVDPRAQLGLQSFEFSKVHDNGD